MCQVLLPMAQQFPVAAGALMAIVLSVHPWQCCDSKNKLTWSRKQGRGPDTLLPSPLWKGKSVFLLLTSISHLKLRKKLN